MLYGAYIGCDISGCIFNLNIPKYKSKDLLMWYVTHFLYKYALKVNTNNQ